MSSNSESNSSDASSDVSSEEESKPTITRNNKTKGGYPKVKFCESWMQDPELKSWLVGHSNNKAYCIVCKKELCLGSGRKDLLRHARSSKHIRNENEMFESPDEDDSTFPKSWCKDPQLKDWLGNGREEGYAYCNICYKKIRIGAAGKKDNLLKHAQSVKHKRNAQLLEEMKEEGMPLPERQDTTYEGGDEDDEEKQRYALIRKYLLDPDLRDFLIENPRNTPSCKYCKFPLRGHKNDFLKHKRSEKHMKNMENPPDEAPKPRKQYTKRAPLPKFDPYFDSPAAVSLCQDPVISPIEDPSTKESNLKNFIESFEYSNEIENYSPSAPEKDAPESSEIEEDENDDGRMSPLVPTYIEQNKIQFKADWNNDPLLNTWLEEKPGNMAFCKICQIYLRIGSGRKDLLKHSYTVKHQRNEFNADCGEGEVYEEVEMSMAYSEEGEIHSSLVGEESVVEDSNVEFPYANEEYIDTKDIIEFKPDTPVPDENEEENLSPKAAPVVPKVYPELEQKRKFKQKWKTDPELNTWLTQQKNTAFCTVCNIYLSISSGRKDMIRHKYSQKHMNNEMVLVKEQCRLCLDEFDSKFMPSIFDKDKFTEMKIYKKIILCSGIKLIKDKALPDKICVNCADTLDAVYNFRKMCNRSEKHFDNLSGVQTKLGVSPKAEKKRQAPKRKAEPVVIQKIKIEKDIVQETVIEPAEEIVEMEYDNGDEFYETIIENVIENEDEAPPLPEMPEMPTTMIVEVPENTTSANEEKSSYKSEYKLLRQVKQKEVNQIYICEICGNNYTQKSKFQTHVRNHSDERPHKCEFCHKSFKQSSQLQVHVRIHTGAKPLKCKYCDRRFASHSSKNRHEGVHRNERLHVCSTCGMSFNYPASLKKHQVVHTGAKDYHCDPCGKSFPMKHNLVSHMKTQCHRDVVAKLPPEENKVEVECIEYSVITYE